MTEKHDPSALPHVPVSLDLDPANEIDVDLADDADTIEEEVEFVGEASSLIEHFKRVLEELIDPSITWILDCLDMAKVQRRFEAGRYRYCLENDAVYRIGLPARGRRPPLAEP